MDSESFTPDETAELIQICNAKLDAYLAARGDAIWSHRVKSAGYVPGSDREVLGFNVGSNVGEAAGQSVMHCHIHLIPRRKGDVEAPRGGVRHIIPGKGKYWPPGLQIAA